MWIFSKLIRRIKQWRRQKRNLREVKKLAKMFGYIEDIVQQGNIYWKEKDNILLIEERLALFKIAEGKEGFQKFLNQISAWLNFQIINAAYDKHRQETEIQAVRQAQQDNPNLTNADITRIRQDARFNLSELPLESLDVIREFDIMIIRATAPSAKDATQENGQLLAVGHFDGTQVEMAMYEDVKHALHNEE